MTVKELFQSLDFPEIAEILKRKYNDNSLLPISRYKENYDIICNITGDGEKESITFTKERDSDVYKIEGSYLSDIVGMDVILPDNETNTKAEAAADILWCSGPFGRVTDEEWGYLYEEILNPSKGDYYALQAKRIDILRALPYCRDKIILRELKSEMKSSCTDLCLSGEATNWFVFGEGERWGRRHNRSKRKRLYRLNKRYDELIKLYELHKEISILKSKMGEMPVYIEELMLSSSSIESVSYQPQTFGKCSRIDYIADLLLNPLYDSIKYITTEKETLSICVLYMSPDNPCTEEEIMQLNKILGSYFDTSPWQLIIKHYEDLKDNIELDITYITQ